MSRKLVIHCLSLLLLTSCMPQIGAMIMDGTDQQAMQSCTTCFEIKSKDQSVTLTCGHSACKECLQRQIDVILKDQSTKNLRCFTCWTHHLTQDEIEKIATPEQQEKLGTIQLKEWLEKQSLVKHCPTPDCSYAFINESKCQSTIDCPQCKKEYCSQCLIKHPEYLSCQAAQERYASVEDKATQSWKNTHSKPCPQCKASIEKNYGCDHMTCSKCRYEFCWKCLGKYPCPRGYSCNGPVVELPAAADNNLYAGPRDFAQRNIAQLAQVAPVAPAVAINGAELEALNTYEAELGRRLRGLSRNQRQEFDNRMALRGMHREQLRNINTEDIALMRNILNTAYQTIALIERNQQTPIGQNMPTLIEVRADMPRDSHGFARMLNDAGIRVRVNPNGTLRIRAHMRWDTFNRILEHANALYR